MCAYVYIYMYIYSQTRTHTHLNTVIRSLPDKCYAILEVVLITM